MTRTFSADEIAAEAGISQQRLGWLVSIGIVRPQHGAFVFGDVFRAKLVSALLAAGITESVLERATAEGWLDLDRVDGYLPLEPGSRSTRTFGEFEASLAPNQSLSAVYEVFGLPSPDPDLPIHANEEAIVERFLDGWRLSNDDDTTLRAARLFAEGTRMATIGWAELFAEKIGRAAQERFRTGEIDRFPPDVVSAIETLVRVAPQMFGWLAQRYLEQQFTANIVDGIERFLAAHGLAATPKAEASPAIVFVDLSGFTRLTEAAGDEAAVRTATSLQRSAEMVATRRGGRLVKLLGDGAMLRFSDAGSGLEAALDLVATPEPRGAVIAHAGVHSGRVVERDLDVFGATVNLASRIAAAAIGGEVLTSLEVVRTVSDPALHFERVGERRLKGISESVQLFRVTRNGADART